MCGPRGYLRYSAVFLLLALCSIEQVSSIKCYLCSSESDPDCISAFNQTKFITDCSIGSYANNHFLRSSTDTDEQRTGQMEFTRCGYMRGVSTIDGRTSLRRGCAEDLRTCNEYKIYYKVYEHLDADTCNLCDTDFCNSSGHLSTGIWSLSVSLIALYFFKL